jgi:hypothetical protein
MEVSDRYHALAAFPLEKSPDNVLDPTADLDAVAKRKEPCPCRESNPVRRPRSLVTILTELQAACFLGRNLQRNYIRSDVPEMK